jgi:hypothetical protein
MPEPHFHVFRRDHTPYLGVEVQIGEPDNDERSVYVHINDPDANIEGYNDFYATFTQDANLVSGYRVDWPGEVTVADLSVEAVLAVVDDILNKADLFDAFEPPEDESDGQE